MLIKPFNKMFLLCCIMLVVAAIGCDTRFQPAGVLSGYVKDLNRSAFISVSHPSFIMPKSLPPSRDRQQLLTQFDIGLLDFLSLQHCDVGLVAGQKNSILGRVMLDSQRFLYEINIIRAIESCDIHDDRLRHKLAQVAKQKRFELPKAFANALFHGPESEVFFSLSNGFMPLHYSIANEQALLNSLTQLVDIGHHLERLPKVDGEQFELDLKALADSEYAGRLLFTLAQITGYLNQVSASLEVMNNQVCGAPLTYLKQQFKRHYVQIIQPYMARLNTSAYQILPLISQLSEESAPLPPTLQVFIDQFSFSVPGSVWRQYQQASQRHAKAWSELFTRCSVSLKR